MLKINKDLFDRWHRLNVRYCHWKSNDTLSQSLDGIGGFDLDIFVYRNDYALAVEGLVQTGFIRVESGPGKSVDGVEGYLGCDTETDGQSYIHLHYRLVTGPELTKGYILPFEELIIQTRFRDPDYDVFRPDPSLELILHYFRASLKVSYITVIQEVMSGKLWFRGKWVRQSEFLSLQVEDYSLDLMLKKVLCKEGITLFKSLLLSPPSARQLLSFREVWLGASEESLRQRGSLSTFVSLVYRRTIQINKVLLRRFSPEVIILPKKKIPHGGTFVAFVGADGSGKSTVVQKIQKHFSWKLEVHVGYLGGLGGQFMLSRPILSLIRPFVKLMVGGGNAKVTEGNAQPKSLIRIFVRSVWAVFLSREKRKSFVKMCQARNRGVVVLSDRFPQALVPGEIDGPLIGEEIRHLSPILFYLGKKEDELFRLVARQRCDLIIFLDVDTETTVKRLKSLNVDRAHHRIERTRAAFSGLENVVVIDANRSLDEVLIDVKRVVWKCIAGFRGSDSFRPAQIT